MSRIKGLVAAATGCKDQAKVNRSKLLGLAAGVWLAAEIAAFYLVVRALGLFVAVLLGFATTLLGLADVKRLFGFWRARGGGGATLDGALQALGSLLLILPGFASDFLGLALKSPSFREVAARRLSERGAGGAPGVIDLAPHEWTHVARGGTKPRGKKAQARTTRSAPCP